MLTHNLKSFSSLRRRWWFQFEISSSFIVLPAEGWSTINGRRIFLIHFLTNPCSILISSSLVNLFPKKEVPTLPEQSNSKFWLINFLSNRQTIANHVFPTPYFIRKCWIFLELFAFIFIEFLLLDAKTAWDQLRIVCLCCYAFI